PRELRLLVVLAGFPDRPLAKTPAHFARQVSRFVAYWTEVSRGRLRFVPTLDELAVTLPGPRRSYVGRPDALARDALAALAAAPSCTRRAGTRRRESASGAGWGRGPGSGTASGRRTCARGRSSASAGWRSRRSLARRAA